MSLLIALAVMTIPLGMIGGVGVAHAGTLRAEMSADCHESAPAPEKSKDSGMSAECALACAALPVMLARLEEPAAAAPSTYAAIKLYGFAKGGPESLDPPPRV